MKGIDGPEFYMDKHRDLERSTGRQALSPL
jgi:hypothetical protein